MWTRRTHEAHTLTPSVLSQILLQIDLSEFTCCGTSERIMPASSSRVANSRMVMSRLCAPMRTGRACGSKRVELVTTNAPVGSASLATAEPPPTNWAKPMAAVAPGSDATENARRATPSATATATDCDANAALMSCKLFRVVCWPPPCVFLALCTTLAHTLLLRIPAAASWAPRRGSTVS